MHTNLRPALGRRLRQRLRHWSGIPAVEWTGRLLLSLAAGFALAGVNLRGVWLPLPLCLAAALGFSVDSFAAYAGGCLGFGAFWGVGRTLEPMAAGLLIEAGYCIFGEQLTRENRWLPMAMTMVFTALVGFFYILEQRFSAAALWWWLLRIAVAGGGTVCIQLAMDDSRRLCRLLVLTLLCAGLCAVRPVGLPLGAMGACALAAAALGTRQAMVMGVLAGIALDLCWQPGSATTILALASLVTRPRQPLLRLGVWLCTVLLGILVTEESPILLASALIGAGLSRLIRPQWLFSAAPDLEQREEQRLQNAAGLLDQLRRCLEAGRRPQPDPETSAVFDRAAEKVCRMCSLWETCWQTEIEDTCESLRRATEPMNARGRAAREDFPPLFVNRCRHLDGFLTAVNRELDDLSCRRQYRSRIKESRLVLSQQYGVLSQALLRRQPEPEPECRFRPEVGFRSQGRRGDTLIGDRGASFRLGSRFYVLLCDGMGTGASAAAEAGTAIAILRTLLQSGTEPDQALELLNGIYILRDDGGFATVDLLEADLQTGEGKLYKWGSAPSYVKEQEEVKKLGTATPPPGLGVGEAYRPEEEKLSLGRGEMAVLVSDGVGGEAAERFMRQYGGLSPKELASGIISCTENREEDDDRTAVVLSLRPCISL